MAKTTSADRFQCLELGEFAKKLFEYVEKRDKQIEEFRQEKIEAAIFRAAAAVGGKDRSWPGNWPTRSAGICTNRKASGSCAPKRFRTRSRRF